MTAQSKTKFTILVFACSTHFPHLFSSFDSLKGTCAPLCCEDYVEETCYSVFGIAESCALIADGGCPCPDGQLKCGSFPGYAGMIYLQFSFNFFGIFFFVNVEVVFHSYSFSGYCAPLCCNDYIEETCYSVTGQAESCALIADGGCPCPEGQIKCGSTIGYAGMFSRSERCVMTFPIIELSSTIFFLHV